MLARSLLVVLLTVLACAPACHRASSPVAETPGRIENLALGVVLLAVPEGFTVAVNEGDRLALHRTAADDPARLTVSVGPVQPEGFDLNAWVELQPAEYDARTGGTFLGARKLRTPIGDAFTARGRFRGDGGDMEEARVLAQHPTEPRLLMVRYEYPATDDTAARMSQLLAVFAELDGLAGS